MFQKIHPPGCNLGLKFPPHVGRSAEKNWQQFRPYIKKSMDWMTHVLTRIIHQFLSLVPSPIFIDFFKLPLLASLETD